MIGKIRKGDIVMADLPLDVDNCLQTVHPCVIMSNFLTCESSMGVTVVPFTSKVESKSINSNHIFVPKRIGGLKQDSIALCECIRPIDKSSMLYKMGKLPINYIREIDKGTAFVLNLNRNYNLEFAFNMLSHIKKLDNLTMKYKECNIEEDDDDKELRRALVNNLKDFCYQNSINFERLCLEGGLTNE